MNSQEKALDISSLNEENKPMTIGLSSFNSSLFQAFDRNISCPECQHTLLLEISPIHLEIEINCPTCLHPLTELIRQHIHLHRSNEDNTMAVSQELDTIFY